MDNKNVNGSVMVIGGGISGIQASLDLADSGFLVHLVEKQPQIGGVMAQLDKTFPTNDCSMCVISPKLVEAGRHLNIDLHTTSRVAAIKGEAGNFTVTLEQKARFIDLDKCTACGECTKVCPVDVKNTFDEGLRDRKAVFKLYPQGMPGAYAVDKRSTAPCKATCPAHVSIQGFIALMQQGKYKEAVKLFKQEHPFPGSCGRVCHHPCESQCTRGDADEPVAIQHLHRFLADLDFESAHPYIPEITEKRDEKIAIAGSGPAGLTAAFYMAQKGYPVTVFEKLPVKGGMMAVGIPEYRLPKAELAKEIQIIEKMGVQIKTKVEFGRDVTLDSLKQEGFASLFVATGLHGSREIGVKGEDLDGVIKGTTFLRNAAMGKGEKHCGKVMVIGGGNVAVDVALTARRLGADEVTMVCLEKRDEMPAWDYEIKEALEEGVTIVNSKGPLRFIGDGSKVCEVEFMECTSVFDENGRFNPQYDDCALTMVDADTVIVAIGQVGETGFAAAQGIELTPPGGLKADPVTLQTPIDWVFAGGDALYGPKSVVEAVASGKAAAESMHRFINGLDLADGRERIWDFEKPDVFDVPETARVQPAQRPTEQRKGNFKEVTQALTREQIDQEVSRCLSCGICSECYQCVDACLAGAIDHTMRTQTIDIQVGAIVAAPGFTPFDPAGFAHLNYGNPNVVTSLEFERILSASGPFQGHLVRPSDHREPEKIAWLQCVGSRDKNTCGNGYCSSVCCMYAAKQTVIAKEHSTRDLDTAVFFMDMRTYGKEFDRYYMRCEQEKGVRFIRAKIHTVENDENSNPVLKYITEDGGIFQETFDMVVLSVGLESGQENRELAQTLGIELNPHRFAETTDLSPVETSRQGIYVCGAFQSPKDIPQSVTEASAAAACAAANLASARGTRTRTKELPPELDVTGLEPRIGVFVCNCGINIGGIADVPEIRDFCTTLPHVVHAEDNLFTCSQDTQDKIKEVIAEHRINRVVVASCSPRTHEPLFQETIREAGLNKYLFEMANIRDQNTWVHMKEPDRATQKAKDLIRMAVAKAACVEPLYQLSLEVEKGLLVIGGGVAGMTAALSAARQGYPVTLVEQTDTLGGVANHLLSTHQGQNPAAHAAVLAQSVENHELIRICKKSEVVETTGILGNFSTQVISVQEGVDRAGTFTVKHGATILATGGREYQPEEYGYGSHPAIYTHMDLNAAMADNPRDIYRADTLVFIQCVGSRNEKRPYCSKVCCTNSIKKVLMIKEQNPDADIYILYRDIRTYGPKEELYTEAREKGIIFMRYDETEPPQVSINAGDDGAGIEVLIHEKILDKKMTIRPDVLVLASAVLPNENKELFELFKVPVNADGFLNEAHAKLRPVDFASEGIFLAGLAHYPKPLDESIAQAHAAVSRASVILSRDSIQVGGIVAQNTRPEKCACCLVCVRSCPYGVPRVVDGHAQVDPALCHGCGICVAECPAKILTLNHFTDLQLLEKSKALFA